MKKIVLIVFIIFSLLIIVYGLAFILNYYLVIKYSIEDCLPLNDRSVFPAMSDRLDEILLFINYAKVVIVYAAYALSIAIYYWRLTNTKKDGKK